MGSILKLYKVTLQVMGYSCTGIAYGIAYSVAENSHEAYTQVRKYLDEKNIGFTKDRELSNVELLADTYHYNDVGFLLHMPPIINLDDK